MRLNFKRLKRKLIGSSPGKRQNRSNTKHKISKVYNYFCVFLIAAVLIAGLPDILDIDSGNSHKKQTSNSNTIITSTSATTTSGQASEPLEPGMMLLKAGTYKFNDVLTEGDFSQDIDITVTATDGVSTIAVYISAIAGLTYDYFGLLVTIDSMVVDGEEQLEEPTQMAAYSSSDKIWDLPIQTHTITKDTVVDVTFGTWYILNTDYNMVNASEGLTFRSNDDGTCGVWGGTCTDTEVVIPPVSPDGDTVIAIRANAFYNEDTIASLIIPSTVKELQYRAFYGCNSLANVILNEGLETIGDQSFSYCDFVSITIPSTVSLIGNGAFVACSKLNEIIFMGTVEQWKNIVLEEGWLTEGYTNDPTAIYVQCTDGQVAL